MSKYQIIHYRGDAGHETSRDIGIVEANNPIQAVIEGAAIDNVDASEWSPYVSEPGCAIAANPEHTSNDRYCDYYDATICIEE